ncbi:FAD/NAD(P)-binding protein [Enterovirga rhinocerotis]|uniref:Putative NAD(P)/FAD-binding protein YdhS n=1 Tax=Enterovirga rhinocerotis TaxID=1339210 RepID=A0A4V3DYL9_9HYPH|nr:FAD-dependent oxidoreductase [Enterovirga rhinocerotis]TDR93109.1 putative NAD(P)/FAD-binding protein YdhS [Enterovirga rhinocerotis]
MNDDMRPIAVIGAGFSGTMTARHLLDRVGGRRILLCERGPTFARGAAYSTDDPVHLLNVRAENMSAFSAEPNHFAAWLEGLGDIPPRHVHRTPVGTFVSRVLYGRYLTSLVQEPLSTRDGAARFRIVPDEVVRLEKRPAGGYILHLACGRTHEIAGAVLALGNLAERADETPSRLVRDPWSARFTEGLEPGRPVVIVGTGLTMVDIALSLSASGFPGPVLAISRRGLVPGAHVPAGPWKLAQFDPLAEAPLSRMLHAMRRDVRAAAEAGAPWQSVIDAMRPVTSAAWQRLSVSEQARFLRHLRPWWDVHRHRMAPPVDSRFRQLVAEGYLTAAAGRIAAMDVLEDGVAIDWQPRGTGRTERLAAQRVILATGSPPAASCGDPLLTSLEEAGLIRSDPHGLGIEADGAFQAIGRNGAPSEALWAVGPIVRGSLWECSAVPDIRRDAERVADSIGARLASPS